MAQGCVLHRAAPRDKPCLPGQQRARWMPSAARGSRRHCSPACPLRALAPCGRDLPGPPPWVRGWVGPRPWPSTPTGSWPDSTGRRGAAETSTRQWAGAGEQRMGESAARWPPPGQHPLCRQTPPNLPTGHFTKPGPGSEVGSPLSRRTVENHARGRVQATRHHPPPWRLQQPGPRCSGAGPRCSGAGPRHLWLSCSICVSSWILS